MMNIIIHKCRENKTNPLASECLEKYHPIEICIPRSFIPPF